MPFYVTLSAYLSEAIFGSEEDPSDLLEELNEAAAEVMEEIQ